MKKTEWFKRDFPSIEDNGILPSIIERLSGTPARIDEIVSNLSPALVVLKPLNKWSIQEEIGHLSDLEPLWFGTANHNATEIRVLLQLLRKQRQLFVDRLINLNDNQLSNVALHPRLKTPMRVIDLANFVAEHDDHHLANIREILRTQSQS
jgi:hypothetical protein